MAEETIPKRIHYIWFGGNPKSELMLRCIESWHRFLPDYEIREWNEENYDIQKCGYVRAAWEAGKWAFASDYARFDILHTHGGIYLDTDVEFLKPLPEEMLRHRAFAGYESTGNVSPGLICGAVPGFWLTEEILAAYDSMQTQQDGTFRYQTVNRITTEVLQRHAVLNRNTLQTVDGVVLYPAEVFCGYDLDIGEYDIRPQTVCVHHYAGTWAKKPWKKQLQVVLKKTLGISGYRKLLAVKRRFFGVSADYLK